MRFVPKIRQWRDWFPIPSTKNGFEITRWVLLEANRLAVTGALLTFVFVSFMLLGMLWTIEMQTLLTETSAVETVLNTLLSGMILLVSIVVSINSMVLSHDMVPISNQEDRVEGASDFRWDLSKYTHAGENPSEPTSFLRVMSQTIRKRAQALDDETLGRDRAATEELHLHADSVTEAADALGDVKDIAGAEFAVLWKGMEFDYGTQLERTRMLKSKTGDDSSGDIPERLDHLIEAFEVFATGKEYFKTLYYTEEMSKLSQTLLVITLPTILYNATTILAINAHILPEFWLFGIPPLQSFVAAAFTISLAPYVVLTAYMLRLSTVARLTSSAGIFSLN